MALTKKQLIALCDARAEAAADGLRRSGRRWSSARPFADTHDVRTIVSLADVGYLRFWDNGDVAHITDRGIEYLQEEGL
jgi:hypothetical protein